MTSTLESPTRPRTSDALRQAVVLVGALLAVAAAALGSGAFGGTPIQDAAGGALSADATPVAPDSPAFRIWSVIYLGLVAFAVVQALPSRRTDARLRATAWWVLASMLLNAAWIGVVQAGWLWASVVVIAVLLAVLARLLVLLVASPPTSATQAVVLDGTVGLYLGWVSVATLADTAAALAGSDVGDLGLGATGWSVVLVSAAAVLAVAYGWYARRRPVVAVAAGVAMAWGLGWVAVGRTSGSPVDPTVAAAATVAAVVALVVPVVATVLARRR